MAARASGAKRTQARGGIAARVLSAWLAALRGIGKSTTTASALDGVVGHLVQPARWCGLLPSRVVDSQALPWERRSAIRLFWASKSTPSKASAGVGKRGLGWPRVGIHARMLPRWRRSTLALKVAVGAQSRWHVLGAFSPLLVDHPGVGMAGSVAACRHALVPVVPRGRLTATDRRWACPRQSQVGGQRPPVWPGRTDNHRGPCGFVSLWFCGGGPIRANLPKA